MNPDKEPFLPFQDEEPGAGERTLLQSKPRPNWLPTKANLLAHFVLILLYTAISIAVVKANTRSKPDNDGSSLPIEESNPAHSYSQGH